MGNIFTSFAKRHVAGIIIAAMIVATIGFGTAFWLSNSRPEPQNIGGQLEYVGKDNVGGCVLWWCEVEPYSVYYYATDMNPDQLKKYFPKAQFSSEPEGTGSYSDEYTSKGIQFKLNNSDQTFLLQYYDNTQAVIRLFNLKQTGKTHIISITDDAYQLALESL